MLISQRFKPGGEAGHLSYGAWNEAEDVLATSSGVALTVLDRDTHSRSVRARRVLGRGLRRAGGQRRLLPSTARIPLDLADDHVFFVAHGLWDLPLLERLRELRRRDITIGVWISEVWPSELIDQRVRYECYSMIDHIFVAMSDAVVPFAEIAPTSKIHFLPPAADVLRFAPLDPFRDRGISVLGIGRRDVDQHHEIQEWARHRQSLYVFDTVEGQARDWLEHRESLASFYQHANVAICNYAKHDVPEVTGGLRLPPGRLFEGLASGSVLLGLAPNDDCQRLILGQTVVEPVDERPEQLWETLDRFADPLEAYPVRTRNLALACRGHDWGHRWKAAYEAMGFPVPFGLENRLDDLAKRAVEYEELASAL